MADASAVCVVASTIGWFAGNIIQAATAVIPNFYALCSTQRIISLRDPHATQVVVWNTGVCIDDAEEKRHC